jgi:hypothetical protein
MGQEKLEDIAKSERVREFMQRTHRALQGRTLTFEPDKTLTVNDSQDFAGAFGAAMISVTGTGDRFVVGVCNRLRAIAGLQPETIELES